MIWKLCKGKTALPTATC